MIIASSPIENEKKNMKVNVLKPLKNTRALELRGSVRKCKEVKKSYIAIQDRNLITSNRKQKGGRAGVIKFE